MTGLSLAIKRVNLPEKYDLLQDFKLILLVCGLVTFPPLGCIRFISIELSVEFVYSVENVHVPKPLLSNPP